MVHYAEEEQLQQNVCRLKLTSPSLVKIQVKDIERVDLNTRDWPDNLDMMYRKERSRPFLLMRLRSTTEDLFESVVASVIFYCVAC